MRRATPLVGFVSAFILSSVLVTPAAQGAEPLIASPDEFLKILEADVVKWAKVVRSAGVTLN